MRMFLKEQLFVPVSFCQKNVYFWRKYSSLAENLLLAQGNQGAKFVTVFQ